MPVSVITNSLQGPERVALAGKLVCLAFLAGIALSHNLWLSGRFFPLLPVAGFLPVLPHQVHSALAFVLVLLFAANIFSGKKILRIVLVALLVIILLYDQNRWQPWVYIYLLLLLPIAFVSKENYASYNVRRCLQIVLAGVYFWSGIYKLNPNFLSTFYTEILRLLFRLKDPELLATLQPFGYIIPAAEVLVAIALLVPRCNFGVIAAVITHLFILVFLSPLGTGSNSVVYPWNVAMAALAMILFYDKPRQTINPKAAPGNLLSAAAVILVWIMPVFNFAGLWDNYLSFSLYSGKANAFLVVVGDKELRKTDPRLQPYFLEIESMQGGEVINVNDWAMGELNVPFYPETRTFKALATSFCALGLANDQLYFLEFEMPFTKRKFTRFTCPEIQ